ncbi:DgyrCDS164 [Dimorphilus gyrociliatus]|uniref:DgyrCDS164 n=1 Tax=Dimorphilus gyrociliatus TaxID=2664684 RepID=A0A7I8V521_9ANNE|nr:DgyrCDS164 [Dimorphilus gyrociliatus]
MSKLLTNNLQSLVKIVESGQGTKVIFLARLTPIPFGLQNAVFAISNIGTVRYLIASILGLLPTQVLNAYIGSTLRSMEEVVSDKSQNITGYLVFIIQLLVTLLLLAYIIRKAKQEFNKALDVDVESPSPASLSEPVSPANVLSKPFFNKAL